MSFSCLLAVAMLIYGPSPRAAVSTQDTANPGGNAQSTPPPAAEPAQSEGAKNEAPTEATVAPGKAKPTEGPKKAGGAAKSAPATGRRGKHTRGKAQAKPTAESEPRKVVVRHGGALEPTAQIAPDLPREEAIQQRQRAAEMLVAAEDRLKLLGARTLDSQQQETVTQIRNYIVKARAALNDGDTQRGHTLALKAYLLADDLVKR